MTEFLSPEGYSPAGETPPVAIASIAPFLRKVDTERARKRVGESIYVLALAAMTDGVCNMAQEKNVHVNPEEIPALAANALNALDPAIIARLTKGDLEATAIAACVINGMLDILAATLIIGIVLNLEGFDQIDQEQVLNDARAWMRHLPANDLPNKCYRWPEPLDMVRAYFRARSSGPVAVRFPAGPVRAAYLLERAARRRSASAQYDTNPAAAVPLIVRCPCLPGLPGARMPDGRQTTKVPNHGTCTLWWKGGRLHRDPAVGPAVILCDQAGQMIVQEFWLNGEFLAREGEGANA